MHGQSFAYGSVSDEQGAATIHHALELGVTFLDTANVYGPEDQRAPRGQGHRRPARGGPARHQVRHAHDADRAVDGRPEHVAAACEASLERLGVEHIAFARQQLKDVIEGYPNLETVAWVQEEPQNMGVRLLMQPRIEALVPHGVRFEYVGRPLRASPSEGYPAAHLAEQSRILREALDAPEARPERPADPSVEATTEEGLQPRQPGSSTCGSKGSRDRPGSGITRYYRVQQIDCGCGMIRGCPGLM